MKKINVEFNTCKRQELHDVLGLSSCEVSYNKLDPQRTSPFIHHHDQNEELYIILEGKGQVYINGQVSDIKKGDCLFIEPSEKRAFKNIENLSYICVQARKNSLHGYTMTDGKIDEGIEKAFD